MPFYYRINLKNFDESYFTNLLKLLNMANTNLGAILMKGKDGYEIFTKMPLSYKEKFFLFFCTHEIREQLN